MNKWLKNFIIKYQNNETDNTIVCNTSQSLNCLSALFTHSVFPCWYCEAYEYNEPKGQREPGPIVYRDSLMAFN